MKISIVGGGNAVCFTALYLAWHCRKRHEVELIYDPSKPPERVGQASLLNQPALLFAATGFNWYHNPIHATLRLVYYMKDGVKRMLKYSMLFLLKRWQCIIVHGNYNNIF